MPNQHRRQEEPTVARHIIAAFIVIDTLMERLGHRSDVRAHVPDSEILTIAVVAATYVGRHHERAAPHRHGCGYLSGRISVSRFNRRLHQLADGMVWIPANVREASPRATWLSSIASPRWRLFAAGRAPGAVGRRPVADPTGGASPNGRRSLDGARISSADRMACPCAFRCCPQGCTT
ncbi:MAG: hypothetical protein J7479_03280 [Roseiflexus sp.]|nr:hypothetical protein [Roseiflexus sp.]